MWTYKFTTNNEQIARKLFEHLQYRYHQYGEISMHVKGWILSGNPMVTYTIKLSTSDGNSNFGRKTNKLATQFQVAYVGVDYTSLKESIQ